MSLSLVDDDASRAIWPFAFKLVYTLTLTKTQLKMDVAVTNNTEGKDLEFTMALHTYYRYNQKNVTFMRFITLQKSMHYYYCVCTQCIDMIIDDKKRGIPSYF